MRNAVPGEIAFEASCSPRRPSPFPPLRLDERTLVWHASACMIANGLTAPVMIDSSAERCASNVRRLSEMTRAELESFLHATALASASVIPARARRPKAPKVRRAWRPSWR